jgi:integrase/recombinase XerD
VDTESFDDDIAEQNNEDFTRAFDDSDEEMDDDISLASPRKRGRPRSEDRMAIIPFIPPTIAGIVPGSDIPADAKDTLLAGQFSPHTRRAYEGDVLLFRHFMDAIGRVHLADVTRDDLIAYRAWLMSRYAPTTVNRRLSVVRSLFIEAMAQGEITVNPSIHLKQLRVADESPTIALDAFDARILLEKIDCSTLLGKRDRALLSLLLRTGLRRSEIGPIKLNDLQLQRGHHTLTVIGKGNKRRLAKIPVDVYRDIEDWLIARLEAERCHLDLTELPSGSPLFVEVRRVGRGEQAHYRAVGESGLTPDAIWYILKRHLIAAGIHANITPHSLRHTFITLALEGRAPLHKVQYAAGHADPRTTERYHHRKDNLDDNATDYVRI